MAKKKGVDLKAVPLGFVLRGSCKARAGEAYGLYTPDNDPLFVIFVDRNRRPIVGLESPALAPRNAIFAYFYEIRWG